MNDRNNCEHNWKIESAATDQSAVSRPTLYRCTECNTYQQAIEVETRSLWGSITSLKDEIQRYSRSSDRHANAIKWLTFGLLTVGIAQILFR